MVLCLPACYVIAASYLWQVPPRVMLKGLAELWLIVEKSATEIAAVLFEMLALHLASRSTVEVRDQDTHI